jgi:hypothetical protein
MRRSLTPSQRRDDTNSPCLRSARSASPPAMPGYAMAAAIGIGNREAEVYKFNLQG